MTDKEMYVLRTLLSKGGITPIKHLVRELKNLDNQGLINCIFDERGQPITATITAFGKKIVQQLL